MAELSTAVASLSYVAVQVGAQMRTQLLRDSSPHSGSQATITTTSGFDAPIVVSQQHFGSPWYVDLWDFSHAVSPYLGVGGAAAFFGSGRLTATILWLAFPADIVALPKKLYDPACSYSS
ncbi:hypothetical protein [Williamsia muralis]|uniref:hypothetical protein n=1 Tax=Williamsia marianensis TaxID=85044 RepID=UPI0039EC2EA9